MSDLKLQVQLREAAGKKTNTVRAQGLIPAVLYGHGIEATSISVDYQTFKKIYEQAGESTLIDFTVGDKPAVKVLIQDVQLDPFANDFLHIDFHQVRMDEAVHANVPLKFIGEAPAVKELSGILVTQLDSVEIKCLPADLIHEIEVNLSVLKTFEDSIHVSDLKAPDKITIENQGEDIIAMVQAPRIEEKEEEKPAEAVPEGEAKPEDKVVEGEAKPEDKK